MPPPLNNGTTPPEFIDCLTNVNLEDEGAVLDALWRHYKQVTVDWSSQPALLPQHWQDTEIIYR
jgi:hypothetical protein